MRSATRQGLEREVLMPNYHVCFWSPERAQVVACDIPGEDAPALLEGFSRAGSYALSLRRKALTCGEGSDLRPSNVELAWIACVCGPAWLFVAASYWFG